MVVTKRVYSYMEDGALRCFTEDWESEPVLEAHTDLTVRQRAREGMTLSQDHSDHPQYLTEYPSWSHQGRLNKLGGIGKESEREFGESKA